MIRTVGTHSAVLTRRAVGGALFQVGTWDIPQCLARCLGCLARLFLCGTLGSQRLLTLAFCGRRSLGIGRSNGCLTRCLSLGGLACRLLCGDAALLGFALGARLGFGRD